METYSLILFALLSLAAIVSGILVVALRSPVASVFSLAVNAVCVAGVFLLLGDTFLAAVQVIVYAGAILVLFLFVVMLLDVRKDDLRGAGGRLRRGLLTLLVAGLGLLLVLAGVAATGLRGLEAGPGEPAGPEGLSDLLLGRYLLPFEVLSMLLLAAMIGIAVLTLRRTGESGPDAAEEGP